MKSKAKYVRKLLMVTLSLSLLVPLLAACGSGSEKEDPAKKRVLRIGMVYGYGDDDSYMRQQLTDIYEYTHPNVEIEFASAIDNSSYRYEEPKPEDRKQPDTFAETKKLLTGSNPVDVMLVGDTGLYKKLVRDNLLKQLDPLMQQDKFDTTDIVPTVLDGIKELGDNNIYGLTPTFSSSALFYNKKFFTDAGVEVPKDNMSWEDIFNLAARISSGDGKNRKFGFQFSSWAGSDPFSDITWTYAPPLQLRMYDDKGEKMTVDTPGWEKVWSRIAKLVKDRVTPSSKDVNQDDNGGYYNRVSGDNFMSGKVGMVISSYGYVNDLIDVNKNAAKIKNFQKIDWDVVTLPTHPEAPGIGGNIALYDLMSINAKAQNPDDAWDFVKFINSEEWAKLKSRNTWQVVSRKKYIQPKEGLNYNIGAFYALKPVPPSSQDRDEIYRIRPNIGQVEEKGREYFQMVVDGKKTAQEALKEWQTAGDKMLLEMKKNPNKPVDAGTTEGTAVSGG